MLSVFNTPATTVIYTYCHTLSLRDALPISLAVEWILETHLHADHLTAAPYLKAKLGGRTAIGARIDIVQGVFKRILNPQATLLPEGGRSANWFRDGGPLRLEPPKPTGCKLRGQTPACRHSWAGCPALEADAIFRPSYAHTD